MFSIRLTDYCLFSLKDEMLAEESAEAEGVVPTDSQDATEVSQVGHNLIEIII